MSSLSPFFLVATLVAAMGVATVSQAHAPRGAVSVAHASALDARVSAATAR